MLNKEVINKLEQIVDNIREDRTFLIRALHDFITAYYHTNKNKYSLTEELILSTLEQALSLPEIKEPLYDVSYEILTALVNYDYICTNNIDHLYYSLCGAILESETHYKAYQQLLYNSEPFHKLKNFIDAFVSFSYF